MLTFQSPEIDAKWKANISLKHIFELNYESKYYFIVLIKTTTPDTQQNS